MLFLTLVLFIVLFLWLRGCICHQLTWIVFVLSEEFLLLTMHTFHLKHRRFKCKFFIVAFESLELLWFAPNSIFGRYRSLLYQTEAGSLGRRRQRKLPLWFKHFYIFKFWIILAHFDCWIFFERTGLFPLNSFTRMSYRLTSSCVSPSCRAFWNFPLFLAFRFFNQLFFGILNLQRLFIFRNVL